MRWTVQLLVDLPDHTVILAGVEYLRRDRECAGETGFLNPEGFIVEPTEILQAPSVRVVSVPVGVLLESERALNVASGGLIVAPIQSHIESMIGGPL